MTDLLIRLCLRACRIACIVAALGAVALYLWVAVRRLAYPFDLEWMEGAVIDHVRFVMEHGQPFVEPSVEFTPLIYNPLYYYLSALASLPFGVDYAPARAVSLVASLASAALIGWLVWRETRSRTAAVVGGGLFIACFEISGAWYDVARVDSTMVAFALLAIVKVRFAQRPRDLVLGAVALALAFATKQSALALVPALSLYLLLFQGYRRMLWFALTITGLVAAFVLVFNVWSGGWYWYYAFEVLKNHAIEHQLEYWRSEIFAKLALAIAFGLFFFLSASVPLKTRAFYALVVVALLGLSEWSRAHSGSWPNVNLPAYAAIALAAGLGVRPFLTASSSGFLPSTILASAAVVMQFVFLYFPPSRWIPSEGDRAEAERLFATIRAVDGEVFLPSHGNITAREGKGHFSHDWAVIDLVRARNSERVTGKLLDAFRDAVRRQRFGAIILTYDSSYYLPELKRYYRQQPADFVTDRNLLTTRVGVQTRPLLMFVPR